MSLPYLRHWYTLAHHSSNSFRALWAILQRVRRLLQQMRALRQAMRTVDTCFDDSIGHPRGAFRDRGQLFLQPVPHDQYFLRHYHDSVFTLPYLPPNCQTVAPPHLANHAVRKSIPNQSVGHLGEYMKTKQVRWYSLATPAA